MTQPEFDRIFKALTGYNPLSWQKRLYEKLLSGDVPASIDLPTGIGKTSIIVIWLIAFAVQAITRKAPCLPRRLIYIVNRRTVVDQATQIAEKIRKRLLGQEEVSPDERAVLDFLKAALQQVAAIEKELPLAISTLRGELADNEEWKADPTRPAIIIGTVDMIGSKLLFSGYGDSYRMRPHHAGLIGQDAIIIHDEAHLTPAFSELLCAVKAEQLRSNEPRPIRIIELSATQRKTQGEKFCLEEEDSQDDFVQTRLNAEKTLHIHRVERGKLVENIVERAKDYQSHRSKILIYVHSPEQAKEIASKLKRALGRSGGDRVALLTGTIRGYERDQLLQNNRVFRNFMDAQSQIEETLYLVCTSAGEVGVDLYAHHLICDATTLESLIQRLGRVNRDGQHQAHIDLFVEEEETQGPYLATVELLEKRLPKKGDGFDVSPRALMELLNGLNDLEKEEVFSPEPKIIPVTDLLLDAWAMTSIREELPGRPSVAAYLHGIEAAPPETYLVWRSEVRFLAESEISEDDIGEWFQHCRIESRERLRDLSDRVFKELKKLAERHKEADLPVLIIDDRGEAKRSSLQELVQGTEEAIRFRTIVLPAEAGGLTEEGILDGNAEPRNGLDILGHDGKSLRLIVEGAGEIYRYRELSSGEEYTELDDEYKSINKAVRQISKNLSKSVSLILPLRLPVEGDEEATARYLVLLAEAKQAATDDPELASYESAPRLKDHLEVAAEVASQITESLGLSDSLKKAVIEAARLHDLGKNRKCWQSAVFNDNPDDPWAKSGSQGMDWRRLAGYRHEFGSLLDAKEKIRDHEERDLILHLIAAHHGRARPHFEPDAWDMERHTTTENEDEAHEVMRRYARLQQRFGRWGLAWLESLVRCADVVASRQAAQQEDRGDE
ncbi:type I-G CRISPR-associated helicase/endonuclease Cas3g [Pyrinomonas methylaliphatogenes]|uniref:CRISPR-associated helicase Cas3, subtype Dpsyc n=1 Tax=Pyrinomonas methylaliphatogenes TaxID=454194 RepID=A0A0B6WXQ5_9BACT|nr:type I-U CRISPR-associated helicase/endonuclease Cas3 [Pyrinomonas methylaliphatogenes]CDM65512.1 CRISPR-associated helicase Cas3, subtype Dpsyc [Pyrinomonas methylaliphatogenes]